MDEGEGLLPGGDGAFELRVFGEFEHGLELRRGAVAGGDEVAAGEEWGGTMVFSGSAS